MLTSLENKIKTVLAHQGFQRYFSNTSWMFGERILRLIAGLFVGVWVARYLGPEQFGLFSYALAFVAIFGNVAKLGLDDILVRDLVHEPNKADLYLGTAFWLKLAGGLVSILLVAIAVVFASNSRTTNIYIFIIASGIIFQSFEVIDFYFQSKVLSKFVSICRFAQLFLSSILKIYFVLTGAELLWFVVLTLIDQVTLTIALNLAYRYQKINSFYKNFDLSIAKLFLKNSWPLIFNGFVIMIYMRIDQIMIKEMLGEKEVGLYSAAVRLSEVWYFIPVIITSSLFPAIVNAKKISLELYQSRLQRLYSFMVWLAIAIAVPMTFLSDWLIALLYGEMYKSAGQVLMIQIWAGVFVFVGVASSRWFLNENLQKKSTLNAVVGAIANVFLNFLLIPRYGICGAAIATVISQAISAYLMNLAFDSTRENFLRITQSIFFKTYVKN